MNEGNTNAEKTSYDKVISILTDIYNYVDTHDDCYLLIHALTGTDIWTIDQYEHYIDRFREDDAVRQLSKKIKQRCESRISQDMIKGKIKDVPAIFLLKAKYGYIDRQQVDHNVQGAINVNVTMPNFPGSEG